MLERVLATEETAGTVEAARFWRAVVEHDARYDGAFVYANAATGTFCRPSCTAHATPRRGDVTFFAFSEIAETAQFRACPHCRPEGVRPLDPQVALVQKACRYIDTHIDAAPTLNDIGAYVALSPYHLQRVFKRVTGITPRQYADACRLRLLKARLRDGESVTCALYDAGYSSSSRLYERAQSQLGMTPATYRRGGAGMHIRYTICACPLGRVLIGITERGVCAVHLGQDDAELYAVLVREYPAATLQEDMLDMCEWADNILDYLDGWQPHLSLPVDVQATAFQWRVWQELQTIPPGETRTYSEIASALGKPKAASAVARAIAENPVAVVIPCHRAERSDGETTSFYDQRGTVARRKLIALEQQPVTEAAAD